MASDVSDLRVRLLRLELCLRRYPRLRLPAYRIPLSAFNISVVSWQKNAAVMANYSRPQCVIVFFFFFKPLKLIGLISFDVYLFSRGSFESSSLLEKRLFLKGTSIKLFLHQK